MSAIIRNTPRLLALTAAIAAIPAHAALSAEERASELEQRLLILERKLELQTEDLDKKAKDAPVVSAGDRGFGIKKGDFEIKFNALAQFDLRTFLNDGDTINQVVYGAPANDRQTFYGSTVTPVNSSGGAAQGTLRSTPQDIKYNDGFVVRRIRPTIQGSIGKLVDFRFTPELAGSGIGDASGNSVVDAYVDLKFSPAASVRIGKQKGPISIERLQSGSALPFIERGLANELAPNRDLGAALFGRLNKDTISYTVGLFNGTADGRDVASGDDSRKEVEGRLFFEPFKNDYSPLAGLGFGFAGSYGNKHAAGSPANPNAANTLPRYRSYGQNPFFGYETFASPGGNGFSSVVIADGVHSRFVPQASFYKDSFGLTAEYAISEQELRRSTSRNANGATDTTPLLSPVKKIRNDAYTVTATYVLTGEDASYAGIKPSNPFTLGGDGWGALELAARISGLTVDKAAFEGDALTSLTTSPNASFNGVTAVNGGDGANLRLADPNASARRAQNFGIGVNWYLTRNVKISADYNRTAFDGGAANGQDRNTEQTVFSRVQLSY